MSSQRVLEAGVCCGVDISYRYFRTYNVHISAYSLDTYSNRYLAKLAIHHDEGRNRLPPSQHITYFAHKYTYNTCCYTSIYILIQGKGFFQESRLYFKSIVHCRINRYLFVAWTTTCVVLLLKVAKWESSSYAIYLIKIELIWHILHTAFWKMNFIELIVFSF